MMMTPPSNSLEILARMETLTADYIAAMETYSLEQLHRQPGDGEWSLGQLYLHLAQSALHMQLRNAEACGDGTANSAVANRRKTEAGEAAFAQGSLPPVRIKVPASPQYTPVQPNSKEEIISALQSVLARMRELEPLLASIPPERTVEHPGLGALNAAEWFALTEMHYRHHLLQQERLARYLAAEPVPEN